MIVHIELLTGRYFDSVRLMQVTREVTGVAGVEAALVAMATELNLRLLDEMGFDSTQVEAAGPDDLLVATRAANPAAADVARATVERSLSGPGPTTTGGLFSHHRSIPLPARRTPPRPTWH